MPKSKHLRIRTQKMFVSVRKQGDKVFLLCDGKILMTRHIKDDYAELDLHRGARMMGGFGFGQENKLKQIFHPSNEKRKGK